MTQISSYYSSIGFRIDQASIKRVDQQMKMMEQKLRKQSLRFKKLMNEAFNQKNMPAIKFKAFSFDTLQLQKSAQIALNKTSRLVRMQISNFEIDQNALNRKMQTSLQRAANQSKISTKFITGNSGGGGVFDARKPALSKRFAASSYPRPSAFNSDALNQATAMMLPGRLAGFSGPALLAAAPIAAAYGVQRGSVTLGNEQAQREAQRTQLDVASGSTSRADRNRANERFFALSSKMGVEAQGLIDPYSKFLKQMLTMGRTYEQGFDLFKDMSIATRGAGGGQQQMERQAYALQQIIGLGHLRSEELNLQLADSNPAIKKYIMEAYSARTGETGVEAFQKALSSRQVSINDVLKAYQNAAQAAGGRVEEFASTVQASQARLANMKFAEQLDRTMSDDVIPGMRKYTEAQAEMYSAMKPLRNATYEAAAGVLSFSASLLKGSAPYVNKIGNGLNNSPALKSMATNPVSYLPALNPITAMAQLGYMGYKGFQDSQAPKIATQMGIDRFKGMQDSFSQPAGIFPMHQNREGAMNALMGGRSTTNNNSSVITFAPVIHSTSQDAESLSRELEPYINNMFMRSTDNLIGEALLQFGHTQ